MCYILLHRETHCLRVARCYMCDVVCSAAVAAAAAADVAILCTSTFSCEGSDRSSLSMPAAEDALIPAVAAGRTPSVVVVTAPGVALLPWSNLTAGILYIGMPGQEAGNAVADILTGAVVPSGKTTLTWPTVENQTQFSASAYPGLPSYFPLEANYEEELLIGYRYFDAHNIAPAFPFGHGLSYTTFKYTALTVSTSNVSCVVTNVGQVTGAEVAQLYISFPASAGEPPLQLKGFQVRNSAVVLNKPVRTTMMLCGLCCFAEVLALAWSIDDCYIPLDSALVFNLGCQLACVDGCARLVRCSNRRLVA